MTFRLLENIESRVVGAIRLVDAVTEAPIREPLQVNAAGAALMRNRSGLYIVREVPGLADYAASYESPPPVPAVGSIEVALTISDPEGRYLPRSASLALPRNPDSTAAADPASLFQPAVIPMFPAAVARVAVNWAVLRVSVVAANGDRLGGALVRVLRNDDVIARGLSDWRGEALVPVAGVPVTNFGQGGDAIVTNEIDVVLKASFDPAVGSRTSDADVRAGRAPAVNPNVDPAALEAAADALPGSQQTLSIAARRTQTVSIAVALT